MKKILSLALVSLFSFSLINSAYAEGDKKPMTKQEKKALKKEMKKHPRLVKAIRELEDAIKYLEAAPDEFGGNKANAIKSAKQAVEDLKKALEFKSDKDEKKK
ncbi:MAG: hypothetical protein U0457_01555 [Candidatus Sericytochromatia bacterium]